MKIINKELTLNKNSSYTKMDLKSEAKGLGSEFRLKFHLVAILGIQVAKIVCSNIKTTTRRTLQIEEYL